MFHVKHSGGRGACQRGQSGLAHALYIKEKPMTTALVFPGQGSQAIGMGQSFAANFPVAAHVFQEVDEALGFSLTKIIKEGPEADLTRTENAQPAIMAASLASLRVMETQMGFKVSAVASCVAGH